MVQYHHNEFHYLIFVYQELVNDNKMANFSRFLISKRKSKGIDWDSKREQL